MTPTQPPDRPDPDATADAAITAAVDRLMAKAKPLRPDQVDRLRHLLGSAT